MSDKAYIDWVVDGMTIKPYDNPLRFLVTSQTEGEVKQYLVQLDSYWCTGQCTCEDFVFRHQPILVREKHNNDDQLRCKHIRAARMAFSSHMIRLLSEQEVRKKSRE